MGQQQLLLVILVTILVGIATVVALNVFGTAAEDANRDAVRQDLLQGASAAQALHAKPTMLDGAGQNFSTGYTAEELLLSLGMPITVDHPSCAEVADGTYGNENGCYYISGNLLQSEFTLVGAPSSATGGISARIFKNLDNDWEIEWGEVAITPPA